MRTKECVSCKEIKSVDDFYIRKTATDGLRCRCKECNRKDILKRRRTKYGLITTIYNSQTAISKKRNHLPPSYTKQEFKKFAISNLEFHRLFDKWIKTGFDRWHTPSFDRKNDYLPYSFDNFNKWMKWKENSDKGSSDRKKGINNKLSKAVIGINIITGKIIKFYSAKEAQRQTGISNTHISESCHNKLEMAGNYKWTYKN